MAGEVLGALVICVAGFGGFALGAAMAYNERTAKYTFRDWTEARDVYCAVVKLTEAVDEIPSHGVERAQACNAELKRLMGRS